MGWGTGNLGGGSGGLNFKVVGGTTAPSNPKENMIWVNTSTKITSYIFSAKEPESPIDGMVWIQTGTSSPSEFNALKKNGIQVCPVSAKQYVSGAWVEKTVKIWKSGAWQSFEILLYDTGNEFTNITGGWELAWTGASGKGTFTLASETMVLDKTAEIDYLRVRTKKKINLSGVRKLYMNFTAVSAYESIDNTYWRIDINVGADNVAIEYPNYAATAQWNDRVVGTTKTISVPIPDNITSAYVTIGIIGKSKFNVNKVWAA